MRWLRISIKISRGWLVINDDQRELPGSLANWPLTVTEGSISNGNNTHLISSGGSCLLSKHQYTNAYGMMIGQVSAQGLTGAIAKQCGMIFILNLSCTPLHGSVRLTRWSPPNIKARNRALVQYSCWCSPNEHC